MGRLIHFETLKRENEFRSAYQKGRRWHIATFVLFYQRTPGVYKVGFVAGKKIGKANRRVRAKRLLRALFILTLPRLREGIYVIVAKSDLLHTDFKMLRTQWKRALNKVDAFDDA